MSWEIGKYYALTRDIKPYIIKSVIMLSIAQHFMTNGGINLSQLKKVLITVPEPLLEEVDQVCKGEKSNRSDFVRRAMKCYLAEKRKIALKEELARGYQEMADINLELSDVYFDLEEEQFSGYEEKLSECEVCDC